jgi:uncharacterized membrane protein
MSGFESPLVAEVLPTLQKFVMTTKLHPILVNFTAALVPVSLGSDFIGRLFKAESLRQTAWWTLLYAMIVTPCTAFTGWLFWMHDDNGVTGMTVHKWLGTGLAALLLALFAWRWRLHHQSRWASACLFGCAARSLCHSPQPPSLTSGCKMGLCCQPAG